MAMKNINRIFIATLAIVSGSSALYAEISIEQLVEQARIAEADVVDPKKGY